MLFTKLPELLVEWPPLRRLSCSPPRTPTARSQWWSAKIRSDSMGECFTLHCGTYPSCI